MKKMARKKKIESKRQKEKIEGKDRKQKIESKRQKAKDRKIYLFFEGAIQ